MSNNSVSDNSTREVIIALALLLICFFSLFVGLFTFKKELGSKAKKDGGNIVSSLLGDKIVVIGLEGPIFDSFPVRSPFSYSLTASSAKEELNKAIEDKQVKGVLLRMNSPGGTVGASQEIYQLVQKLREKKKPVVVSMGDVCASGCYYIASAADRIVANAGTLTGSIGVIAQGVNVVDLFSKIGLRNQTFKAGKYKDIASSQRNMTEEEKKIMQALLNDSYNQFLDDIEQGRGIERAELNKIAEGLIYTGNQALEVNLVDDLGTYEDSKDVIKDVLEEDYEYKNAEAIDFHETWTSKSLSPLEDLFELSIGDNFLSAISGAVAKLFGVKNASIQSPQGITTMSKYQPLWMIE